MLRLLLIFTPLLINLLFSYFQGRSTVQWAIWRQLLDSFQGATPSELLQETRSYCHAKSKIWVSLTEVEILKVISQFHRDFVDTKLISTQTTLQFFLYLWEFLDFVTFPSPLHHQGFPPSPVTLHPNTFFRNYFPLLELPYQNYQRSLAQSRNSLLLDIF